MSTKIQVRRGLKADLPQLSEGEFGLATDSKQVFIGTDVGNTEITIGNADTVDGKHASDFAPNTLALSKLGGRNKCYKLCSFPRAATGYYNSEALYIEITDSVNYDVSGVAHVQIMRNGWIFATLAHSYIPSFYVYLSTYENVDNVDVYLFAEGCCDTWELHSKRLRNVMLNIQDMGANSYVPPGTLIANSKTGEGCSGNMYINNKRVATTDQLTPASLGYTQSLVDNGWTKFPNGLIMQWGMYSESASKTSQLITLPIAFLHKFFCVVVQDQAGREENVTSRGANIKDLSSFELWNSNSTSIASHWFALGY